MQIHVITLFPELVRAVAAHGIVRRAADSGAFALHCLDPRDETDDPHRTVDDRPFGGGPGMVMKPGPVLAAVERARRSAPRGTRRLYLSPQGRPLNQAAVEDFATAPGLILLAGRYEGIDERALEQGVDEEWSIGDYVLSGGELAAMVVVDAVVRLLPGALGDDASAAADSFSDGLLEGPQYTRPESFEGRGVPPVLLSGDHGRVAEWRRRQALGRTWLRRPDLLMERTLDRDDRRLLDEFIAEHEHGPFVAGSQTRKE